MGIGRAIGSIVHAKIGAGLLGAAFNDALYQSFLNYRSLVGGFTHPLLDVVRCSVELWAQAGRRSGD